MAEQVFPDARVSPAELRELRKWAIERVIGNDPQISKIATAVRVVETASLFEAYVLTGFVDTDPLDFGTAPIFPVPLDAVTSMQTYPPHEAAKKAGI
jgi:hypothetical protein